MPVLDLSRTLMSALSNLFAVLLISRRRYTPNLRIEEKEGESIRENTSG